MAWARIQSASFIQSVNNVASFGVAYGTNLSSGTKLIALVVIVSNGGVTSTVKDGSGNALTKILSVSLAGSSGNGDLSLWAADTPAGDVGAKPTLTATFSNSTNNGGAILIQEVSGLAAGNTVAAMIDGTAASNSGSGGASTGSPAYSSSVANEYLVSGVGDDAVTAAETYTAPSGFTIDANSVNGSGNVELLIGFENSTGGSESASWARTGVNNDWATILCAFKLSASGATGGPVQQPQPGGRTWRRRFRRPQTPQWPLGTPAAGAPSPFFPPRTLLKGPAAARKGTLTSSEGETGQPGVPAPFHPPRTLLRGAAAAAKGKLTGQRGQPGQPSPFRLPGLLKGPAAAKPGRLASARGRPGVPAPFTLPRTPLRGPAKAGPGKMMHGSAPQQVGQPSVPAPFFAPHSPLRGPAAARKGTAAGVIAPPPVVQPNVPAPFFPPRTLLRGQAPVRARTPLTGIIAPPPAPPPAQVPRWQGSTHMPAAAAAGNLIQGANHTGTGGPGDLKGDFERSGD